MRVYALSPAIILFVSANVANVGNLAFNMVFARVLGPERFGDLALLLTLKLSVLSLFTCIQSEWARRCAIGDAGATANETRRAAARGFLPGLLVMTLLLALCETISNMLTLRADLALAFLCLCVPAILPLSLARGWSQGRLAIGPLVASYQAEWALRLGGGLLAYWLGLGLTGIAAALVISIYVASILAMPKAAKLDSVVTAAPPVTGIWAAALPFLALQFSQILFLDGDLIIAQAKWPAETAGLVAGLGLIQRIFFFAFLSFSIVLVPNVAKRIAENDMSGAKRQFTTLAGMIVVLAILPLLITAMFPVHITALLLGGPFIGMADYLISYGSVGLAFTITHLGATFLIACGKRIFVFALPIAALAQAAVLCAVADASPESSVAALITAKLSMQIVLAATTVFLVMVARPSPVK